MAAEQVTSEEIAQLPHFGKIAFAARCARIGLDLAYPPDFPDKFPGPLERLHLAERWGCEIQECQKAKQYAVKIRARQPFFEPTGGDEDLWRKVKEVLTDPLSLRSSDRVESTLAAAIQAAIHAALSPEGNAGKDDEAAGHAQEAYKLARKAFLRNEASFDDKVREDFDALRRCIDVGDEPSGAVPPDFFTKRDPKYYPPAAG